MPIRDNDIEGIIELTFSVDDEKFGERRITQYLYCSDYHRHLIHPNINGSRGIVLGMENRLTICRYTCPSSPILLVPRFL